jgi:hypothetical protein
MSSEPSSIPLPDLEGAVAGNSPTENRKTVKVENPEHPITSPLSGPDNILSSPTPPAQSDSIEMASTPPAMKQPDGQSNTVNNSGSCPDADEDSTSQNPADQIEEFDWSGLQDRYAKAMEQCRKSEEALSDEVEQLVKVLEISTVLSECLLSYQVFQSMGRQHHSL